MKVRAVVWPVVLALALLTGCGRRTETPETPEAPTAPEAPSAARSPVAKQAAVSLTEEELEAFLDAYPQVVAAVKQAGKPESVAHPMALIGWRANKKVTDAIKGSGMSVNGFFAVLGKLAAALSLVEQKGAMAPALKEMEEKAKDPNLSPEQKSQMEANIAMMKAQVLGAGPAGGIDDRTRALIEKHRARIDQVFKSP